MNDKCISLTSNTTHKESRNHDRATNLPGNSTHTCKNKRNRLTRPVYCFQRNNINNVRERTVNVGKQMFKSYGSEQACVVQGQCGYQKTFHSEHTPSETALHCVDSS